MKKLSSILLLIIMICFFLLPISQAQDYSDSVLIIVNAFDMPVCQLFIALSSGDSWGANRLEISGSMPPSAEQQWVIPTGVYNLLLASCQGEILAEVYQLTIDGVFMWTPELSISNEDNLTIDTLLTLGTIAINEVQCEEAKAYFNEALSIAQVTEDRIRERATLNLINSVEEVCYGYRTDEVNDTVEIRIVNGFDVDICQITITDIEQLETTVEEEVVKPETESIWNLKPSVYDIEVFDCSGQSLFQAQYNATWDGINSYQWFAEPDWTQQESADSVALIEWNNLGLEAQSQQRFDDALNYYQQALQIATTLGDPTRIEGIQKNIESVALIRGWVEPNNLARKAYQQSQYDAALFYLNQALDHAITLERPRVIAKLFANIASVYLAQGRYTDALAQMQVSLEISRSQRDRNSEGQALLLIGEVYEFQEQWGNALSSYNEAFALARDTGNYVLQGNTLLHFGNLYLLQQDYNRAMVMYERALSIHHEIGNTLGEISTHNSLGRLFMAMDDPDTALVRFQEALVLAQEIGDLSDEGAIYYEIARLYLSVGETSRATEFYKLAIEAKEGLLYSSVLNESVASLSKLSEDLDLHDQLVSLLIQTGDLVPVLEYAERGRGILLRDELRNGVSDFHANLEDKSLLEQEETLRIAVVSAQNRVNQLNESPTTHRAVLTSALIQLQEARDNYSLHLQTIALAGGFLNRQLALEVASVSEIQAVLPDNTTLAIYGISENSSYVVLVTKSAISGLSLPVSGEVIESNIRTLTSDRLANIDVLRSLYISLFEPIQDEVTTENLIISPDGILNYIPFAALQAPDGSYLIDHYNISYTPSGTALVLLNERGDEVSPTSNGLVLAQRDAAGLSRLQNANSEAERIAADLGVSSITNATEADLREASTGAEVIHISAHAELNRFAPLYSVIHLGAEGDYDGRLEVREIYELDLSQGTELVILSGCDTASGGTGEDFGLLTWAFFGAGADQVVASLWSVDDAATAELLTAFMEARETAGSEAEALRLAMLATRENYPDPYYWASFVLVGEP